jgi:hypothetical protein
MSTPIERLCAGLPHELVEYFQLCRALRFDEKPDYSCFKKLFKGVFSREGYSHDFVFDWTQSGLCVHVDQKSQPNSEGVDSLCVERSSSKSSSSVAVSPHDDQKSTILSVSTHAPSSVNLGDIQNQLDLLSFEIGDTVSLTRTCSGEVFIQGKKNSA